jgi:hypothetical protein
MLSSIREVNVLTVYGSSILCFESHLLAGLWLPPSKFLAVIMNYLGYSLVHFNANVIAALSNFVTLCECWLGFLPTPAYSGITTLHPDMPNLSMVR